MLVLLSFGLVLLATILLVVGLLNDDSINLIYLSIAASATAAVVLYLAFRRARPEKAAATGGPAPLGDDLDSIVHDTGADDVTAVTPAAPVVTRAAVDPGPPAAVEPAPVDTAGPAEEAWADDADWEVDDVEFPIADYDELSVAEIMPLLPQLYSDELDIVRERELTTKNRATIIARLDKLAETGTDADAEEAAAGGATGLADPQPEPEPEPTPAPVEQAAPVVAAPAPATRSASLLDDDEDDAAAFFPIADYDDLSVSQIIPLLPQLEADELEDVKARELDGANRATLLAEIDRHLGVGVSTPAWSAAADEPVGLDELEEPDGWDAVAEEPAAPSVVAASEGLDDRDRLPIQGYDTMTVAQIRPRLADLSDEDLRQVLQYEEARDNRRTIVSEIQRRLMAGEPVVTSSSAPAAPPEPTRAPAKRATRKAAAAAKTTKATRKATKAPAKRATKAAAKRNATRFPIAGYDELTVAEIRPRLARLSKPQLEQVRERELTGAGRRTILNDIESRLS